MKEYIKFGFGFFIGYEAVKIVTKYLKELYPVVKDRIKNGY